jgi:uncharacterized membrane protein YhaH (DUF805 family)
MGGILDFFISVLSNLIAALGAAFIIALPVYIQISKPLFIPPFIYYLIVIIVILVIIAIIVIYLKNRSANQDETTTLQRRINDPRWKVLICVIAMGFIVYNIYPQYIPPFKITEPNEGDTVKLISSVSGHGAPPGSSVDVYVIDQYGQTWPEGTANTTTDGSWECKSVYFGQYGSQYVGQKFTMFAKLTEDGKTYQTPSVNVIRS